jgi:hypothetical protein
MSNPFDAQTGAYEDVQVTTQPQPQASGSNPSADASAYVQDQAKEQTKQQVVNAYEATVDDVRSANAATADHNAPPEPPSFMVKCYNWFPLRWFLFGAGFGLTILAIVDMGVNGTKVKGIGDLVFFYIFCIGIVIMIVEVPVTRLTRSCQLGIYFWFRLLSRLWGRAWFYLFISLLCFAQLPSLFTATTFGGLYLIFLVPVMFVVSRIAALKYQRIFVFVAAGTEGPQRDVRFEQKFDELDIAKTGFIDSVAIVKLADQAGRTLSNSERHAIQTFLDASSFGRVSKEDFVKQFREYNLKQRFL